ncbi:MAG TPA: hypothetical protein VGN90_06545 [Pyrinomonadaceae bacterium]|jgi:hypothetical protein|nr:hypothetical protein [Pyrinomonadaceae bacterium]
MTCHRKLTLPFIFALLLAFAGCTSEEEEAYKSAYEANRDASYQVGFRDGEDQGRKQGTTDGTSAALEAAATGRAWQLYWVPELAALVFGLSLGLILQYSVLLVCRRSGRLPQFSTVAFVPAMKSTLVYAIFERRRDVMLEIEESLSEMAARQNLQVAKIRQLKEALAFKVKALSSIDELTQSRLIELAAEELEKIVSTSAAKAEMMQNNQATDHAVTRITHTCPSCQSLVRFRLQSANEIVTCPNQACGQPIKLPPVLANDGAPLIFDVND